MINYKPPFPSLRIFHVSIMMEAHLHQNLNRKVPIPAPMTSRGANRCMLCWGVISVDTKKAVERERLGGLGGATEGEKLTPLLNIVGLKSAYDKHNYDDAIQSFLRGCCSCCSSSSKPWTAAGTSHTHWPMDGLLP